MRKIKVLVVEDGVTARLYYRQILEREGFEVEEAMNGIEGLERALQGGCELMVVDVNMPRMDGYRFISEVRHDPAFRAIPVVMISTESEDEDAAKAYDAGANFYMVKPADPEEFACAVRLMTGRD